jgi:predicted DNA-binding protein YlxM (UPF0122 family)
MRVPVATSTLTEIADRRKKVASYYLNKMPMVDIAEKLGVHKMTISRDVKELNKVWAKEAQADISEHIARELAELERMELEAAAMYQHFKGNEKKGFPLNSYDANKWFESRLKVKDRRAKLLGLDRPQKLDVDLNQPVVINLTRMSCRKEDVQNTE